MPDTHALLLVLVMALVTYLIRMLPMVAFRKKLDNRYLRSFLFYVPYTVLSAMTFPAILFSTAMPVSAVCGTLVAFVLAYREKTLFTVAASSCAAVYAVEFLYSLF